MTATTTATTEVIVIVVVVVIVVIVVDNLIVETPEAPGVSGIFARAAIGCRGASHETRSQRMDATAP